MIEVVYSNPEGVRCNSIYCLVRGWLKYSQYRFNRQTYRLDRLTEKCMNIHLYSTFQ